VNPFPWLGAYHASELPLVFGTYGLTEPEGSQFPYEVPTENEAAVSAYMQGAWVAFAKDPVNGLMGY
jgi:carboxylesterase type B